MTDLDQTQVLLQERIAAYIEQHVFEWLNAFNHLPRRHACEIAAGEIAAMLVSEQTQLPKTTVWQSCTCCQRPSHLPIDGKCAACREHGDAACEYAPRPGVWRPKMPPPERLDHAVGALGWFLEQTKDYPRSKVCAFLDEAGNGYNGLTVRQQFEELSRALTDHHGISILGDLLHGETPSKDVPGVLEQPCIEGHDVSNSPRAESGTSAGPENVNHVNQTSSTPSECTLCDCGAQYQHGEPHHDGCATEAGTSAGPLKEQLYRKVECSNCGAGRKMDPCYCKKCQCHKYVYEPVERTVQAHREVTDEMVERAIGSFYEGDFTVHEYRKMRAALEAALNG